MNMPDYLVFLISPIFLDTFVLSNAKHMFIQFLDGVVNVKKRSAFHRKQKFSDRLTLNYISPLVKKKYADKFHTLHRIYRFYLYSILPQYALAVLLYFLFGKIVIVPISIGMMALRIIVDLIFRVQQDNHYHLKCVQKKKRP